MINRLGKENVKKMIGSYPVVVLLGPRGSGKRPSLMVFQKNVLILKMTMKFTD